MATVTECKDCSEQHSSEEAESPRSPRAYQFAVTVVDSGERSEQVPPETPESSQAPSAYQFAVTVLDRVEGSDDQPPSPKAERPPSPAAPQTPDAVGECSECEDDQPPSEQGERPQSGTEAECQECAEQLTSDKAESAGSPGALQFAVTVLDSEERESPQSPKEYHFTVTVLDGEEDQLSSVKVEGSLSPRRRRLADAAPERGESSEQLASPLFPKVYQLMDFVDRGEIAEDLTSEAEQPLPPRVRRTADAVIERVESADHLPSAKMERRPHSPKVQQIAAKTVSRVHPPVGILLVTALYFGEVASACFVTIMYSQSKDHFWMALTIIFLLVPAIMDQFTLIFVHRDLTSDKPLVLFMHLILMGPLIRCMEALGLYWTSGKKEEPYVTITRKKVLRKESEVELEQEVGHSVRKLVTHRNAFKRMAVIQAFLGSTPQLTLQLYVTVVEQYVPTNRAVLMGMCLASITHGALLCNVLAIQIRYDDYKIKMRPLAFACIILWRSLEICVRIFVLVLLGTVFKDYVVAIGGLNFLVFFFLPWVEFWRSGAKLSDIAERHVSQLGTVFVLLSITLLYAGINVFCWSAVQLRLGDRDLIDKSQSWTSLVVYYIVRGMENITLVLLWYFFHTEFFEEICAPHLVLQLILGYCLAIFFMLLFMQYLHPCRILFERNVADYLHCVCCRRGRAEPPMDLEPPHEPGVRHSIV
ncbi:hypothetical protein lerEdw1_010378 [Lerista edwardsae]|nr:hypothetical protein lerEdw1_010378 [Lerista edwardsae]